MKLLIYLKKIVALSFILFVVFACEDRLDEPAENTLLNADVDFTNSENMILPLIGSYQQFQSRGWEQFPLISVRGDDVNAGGLGDQQDFAETDLFNYNKDYWMYNSLWQSYYADIIGMNVQIEQILLYGEHVANQDLVNQYIAEVKTLRAFLLFQISRVWGKVFIVETPELTNLELYSKDEIMQYISDQMDEAIPYLEDTHPNQREDISGGVTKYTALAIKALANLELENYQAVANATSEIIGSTRFELEPDFYQLFKIPGKLNNENILEFQFSDFGQSSGDNISYLFAFFGPQGWTPAVDGSSGGWGFYEPSMKYIKFMLDRGESVRLETSVIFTDRGISEIQSDPNYATLPSWISNTTRDGDIFNDYSRAMFVSGKHYLPSVQLTPGRTDYGTNDNFTCIRYAEILLMHAEALTQGATGTGMNADQAVNSVRQRAGLASISNVTNADVMDEKFAELAMEWGTRYFDMLRLGEYSELSYDGRSFSEDKAFLPYPQAQVDLSPILNDATN